MINFLKYKPYYFAFSALIFFVFIGNAVYKYKTRGHVLVYSVDFTGGTQVLLKLSKPAHSEEVVRILQKEGLQGVAARDFSDHEVLVRVSEHVNDSNGLADRIREIVEKNLNETTVEIEQVDSVGAGTSAALWLKSIYAILLGLLTMLLYTWWRFWSISYGFGVWVSLFHDAIVIVGFFMLFNYEISTEVIAAILVLLGYSINDTIVIFARIRENANKLKHISMPDIVNLSINETLRRTILTSAATLLVVIALLVFGGHALQSLSIALLVGIIFGTYSSIAVASPVMLWLHKDKRA